MTIDDYNAVYHLWISTPGMGLNNIDDTVVDEHPAAAAIMPIAVNKTRNFIFIDIISLH